MTLPQARIEHEVVLRLPPWVDEVVARHPEEMPGLEDRMRLVQDLAREQVRQGTGGPFAAAAFHATTGSLVSVGLNLVVSSCACIAHAEMVALALAGRRQGGFHLGDLPAELVSSTEPCAMCLGAIPWSGVVRLACGGRDEDARAIGFDEGDKPDDWVACLSARGIEVVRDVLRAEAIDVLAAYEALGGPIYNGAPPS